MSGIAKILARVADRYGTGVIYLARRPEIYAAPLRRRGVSLADITPAAVARAAAYEREWDAGILERVRVFNENVAALISRRGDNIGRREKQHPTKDHEMLKARRSDVVAIFTELGYPAEKWDDKKLQIQIAGFAKLADDEDPPADKNLKKLFAALVKASAGDEEVDLLPDDPKDKKKPAASPSGSPSDDSIGTPPSGSPSDSSSGSPSGSPSDVSGSPSDDGPSSEDPSDVDASGSPSGSPSADSSNDKTPPPATAGKPKPAATKGAEEFVGVRELVAVLTRIACVLEPLAALIGTALALEKKGTGKGGTVAPPTTGGGKPATEPGGEKLSDVIEYIAKIMKGRTKDKAISAGAILDKLCAKFEKRAEDWLKEKMNVQLGGRLEAKYGIVCKKTSDKKYYAGEPAA